MNASFEYWGHSASSGVATSSLWNLEMAARAAVAVMGIFKLSHEVTQSLT